MLTKTLTRDALVAGTRFFWCRYAFGIAVLQRDISEKAWQTIDLPLDLDFVRSDRHRTGAILRRSSGMTITFHDPAKAHASLRSALSAVQVHRDKGASQTVHLFYTMRHMRVAIFWTLCKQVFKWIRFGSFHLDCSLSYLLFICCCLSARPQMDIKCRVLMPFMAQGILVA